MRRLMFFALGLLFGAAVGSALAMLLTPTSGNSLRTKVKARVERAVHEGQRAAEIRRMEMEQQLAALTSPRRTNGSPKK